LQVQADAVSSNLEEVVKQTKRIVNEATHQPSGLCEVPLAFLDVADEASLHDS
jgi:hypothetical protein